MDKLLFGLQVALIGLVVVFLLLVILIGIIKLFSAFIPVILKTSDAKAKHKAARAARKQAKKDALREEKAAKEPVPATKAEAIDELTPKTVAVQPADDAELVAVLAAAAAAVMGTPVSNVRIASYRRTQRSAWSRAGRREQLSSY